MRGWFGGFGGVVGRFSGLVVFALGIWGGRSIGIDFWGFYGRYFGFMIVPTVFFDESKLESRKTRIRHKVFPKHIQKAFKSCFECSQLLVSIHTHFDYIISFIKSILTF